MTENFSFDRQTSVLQGQIHQPEESGFLVPRDSVNTQSNFQPVKAKGLLLNDMIALDLKCARSKSVLQSVQANPTLREFKAGFKPLSVKIKAWVQGNYGTDSNQLISHFQKETRQKIYTSLKSIMKPKLTDRLLSRPNTAQASAKVYLANTLSSHTPLAFLQEISLFLACQSNSLKHLSLWGHQEGLEVVAYQSLLHPPKDTDHMLVLLMLASKGDIACVQAKALDIAGDRLSKVDLETIKLIQGAGVDLNSLNSKGQSLAHVVVEQGRDGLINQLVSDFQLDLNVKDSAGLTPLHRALKISDAVMITKLLQAGADILALDPQGLNCNDLVNQYERAGDVAHIVDRAHWAAFQASE